MSASLAAQPNGSAGSVGPYNVKNLKKWSCLKKRIPGIEDIRQLHVYDFDNTLFLSPLPNRQLWNGPSIGFLQSQDLVGSGWWHDVNILACTGEGVDKEEPRAWEGWWNEQIVELVRYSMKQPDALTVLLTGRSEAGFAELIQRMVKSKELNFDLICLKPLTSPSNQKFPSTLKFKQVFLEELIRTYHAAEDMRIYEDRIKHVEGFRDFLANLNETLYAEQTNSARKPIKHEVVEVAGDSMTLDPVTEVKEVQRMLNAHNTAILNGGAPKYTKPRQIKRTVLYTGYLIPPAGTEKLLNLIEDLNPHNSHDMRTLANNVMITPRPCPANILSKVGGLGKKFRWKVVALGSLDDKVWAARVEPIPPTATYHSENSTPFVVLAIRNMGKPLDATRIHQWSPLPEDKVFELDTVVGEKVLLRVEEERLSDFANSDQPPVQGNSHLKRQNPYDEDFPTLGSQPQSHSHANDGNRRPNANGGQQGNQKSSGPGNVGGPRGNKGGAGGRNDGSHGRKQGKGPGRNRGRNNPYRSLDDMSLRSHQYPGNVDGASDYGGLTY